VATPALLGAMLRASDKISDLIFSPGRPPQVQVYGQMIPVQVSGFTFLTADDTRHIAADLIGDNKQAITTLREHGACDISFGLPGLARFRVNVFIQRGSCAVVMRVIPTAIPDFASLRMPPQLSEVAKLKDGIVLVTGPAGSGKSSTLAVLLDAINREKYYHIITIEDPIEFLHRDKRSFINQREVEVDTANFSTALRAALRQDPDVILVGEMRDLETISTALLAAETGHLVFSTLHTLDATETIQRIIAVFPPPEQKQIRLQLAATLKAVVSQRLVRRADDQGRVPAVEIMIATGYVRDCIINADKTRLIHDAIAAGGSQYGMQTFDQSLFDLYSKQLITLDEALMRASNADEFRLRIQGVRSAADAAREEMEKQMADFERFARK